MQSKPHEKPIPCDPAADREWMEHALGYARDAAQRGEVPVGAILVKDGRIITGAGNSPITTSDPTAHAEILTLRQGGASLGNYRLPATTLYVTLEPCLMCMGAIIHARVERLVFGATDPKTGAAGSMYDIGRDGTLNHTVRIEGGVLAEHCASMLRDFFLKKR